MSKMLLPLAIVAGALACGSSNNNNNGTTQNPLSGAPTITISNYTFTPQNLNVAPGTTINVVNQDGFDHTATSQSAQGAFVAGSVAGISFDTGPFTGTKQITIPSSAPVGTVIPYFCNIHKSMMRDQPQITVTATATQNDAGAPPPPPGGGGGGY
jgi:plastocyanin